MMPNERKEACTITAESPEALRTKQLPTAGHPFVQFNMHPPSNPSWQASTQMALCIRKPKNPTIVAPPPDAKSKACNKTRCPSQTCLEVCMQPFPLLLSKATQCSHARHLKACLLPCKAPESLFAPMQGA